MTLRSSKRGVPYAVVSAVFLIILLYYWHPRWTPNQPTEYSTPPPPTTSQPEKPKFVPGTPKPPGSKYTRTLVIGRLASEDVSWLDKTDLDINRAIYVVDEPALSPDYQVPKNKGHEAMVYLTYIIDHYHNLSDTTIFMHPHQVTWHNNDLLDSNAYLTIKHMSDEHIARVGYFNTRCHHEPGCPDWLHLDRPDSELDTYRKMEEKSFSLDVWYQLHPGVTPPHAISQPCCAQFALSRDRILANPREEYIRYREWLLNTPMEDIYSGRIMEYSWQYLLAGVPELCPAMHLCYCDGYGICFGGPSEFDKYFDLRNETRALRAQADELVDKPMKEAEAREMRNKAQQIDIEMEKLKKQAFERGNDPRARAEECGRPWREGDGY